MNADPEVMRHFPALLTREQSAASMDRQRRVIEERGWGLWVVEVDGAFAGFTGLDVPSFSAPFMPCTEIGWRFRREYWGRGLACHAALEALHFGFHRLNLAEIVSFTAATNVRSQRLMQRLGLERDANGDFDHPAIPQGHVLRRHVLFRLRRGKEGAPSGGKVASLNGTRRRLSRRLGGRNDPCLQSPMLAHARRRNPKPEAPKSEKDGQSTCNSPSTLQTLPLRKHKRLATTAHRTGLSPPGYRPSQRAWTLTRSEAS